MMFLKILNFNYSWKRIKVKGVGELIYTVTSDLLQGRERKHNAGEDAVFVVANTAGHQRCKYIQTCEQCSCKKNHISCKIFANFYAVLLKK